MTLLFWATHANYKACQVQKKVQTLQREVSVNKFKMHFKVVPNPQRQVAYLIYNFLFLKKQNNNLLRFSPDNYQELEFILNLLKSK